MLQFFKGVKRDCEGVSRRDFLRVGAIGAFGLTLPGWLRLEQALASTARKDINCILMWMHGGPSHIDTFDPKPEAPAEIRGEFAAIPTNLPGVHVVEHLPRVAQQLDKISIIRSLNPKNGSHGVADAYMMSGHPYSPATTYPCYGSVIAKEKGDRDGMPAFVQLGNNLDRRFSGGVAGILGDAFNPFEVPEDSSQPNFSVRNVSLPAGIDMARVNRRRTMLGAVDVWQKQLEHAPQALDAMDAFYQKAYSLITSPKAKEAFDLKQEPDKARDLYGRNSLGHGCLLARRLIEAGVRFVTITDGGWDTHQNNFKSLKERLLPRVDRALSALAQDLYDRGMLETTLVVWMGDFGRTPVVNPSAGRDHWASASVMCMFGGGLKCGVVVGETDKQGNAPVDNPYIPEDVGATIYTALGVPLDTTHRSPDGRPIQVNYDGRVIRELV